MGTRRLAPAKVLFHERANAGLERIEFTTGSQVSLAAEHIDGRILMRFPAFDLQKKTVPMPLVSALGVEGHVLESYYEPSTDILMLVIDSVSLLREIAPVESELLAAHDSIGGVSVTARNDGSSVVAQCGVTEAVDFCSRFFWPWIGTLEDPVTGAAHSFLGPYWAGQLGKQQLNAFQMSERGGLLEVNVLSDSQVELIGSACIVLQGELLV